MSINYLIHFFYLTLFLKAKNLLIKKFNIITTTVKNAFVIIFGIGILNNTNPPTNSTIIVNALPSINFKN